MTMRNSRLRAACSLVLLAASGCGSSHVMLQTPNTVPGARFQCTLERDCEPAEVDVPSRHDVPSAVYLTLPDACAGRFHQLVIYEADSSDPKIGVTCARAVGSAASAN